ncbi:MAG: spheroidene monooxygenase [Parafilimonas sp.]
MYCTLIITRYPKHLGLFGFLSMALFHLPLWLNKKIKFFKLMGSGKDGSFDIHPDLNQWALLFTADDPITKAPAFLYRYWKFFRCDIRELLLQPIEGHGLWDGKKVFGELPKETMYDGPIAVLTRATIRLSRLKDFWSNVDAVAGITPSAKGLIISYGIGEVPWIKQATFSIWENKAAMKNFAYSLQQHKDVIHKTRSENWYSEEMFVRFRVINTIGFNYVV